MANIEGTYTLDGMLQGSIPEAAHADMSEKLREWSKAATESGFPFSLEIDGGRFSLLCGTQVQQIEAEGLSISDTLVSSLNALIESFPPEGRAQLFSTIRSTEIVPNAEIQGVYLIGPDGLFHAQTRRTDATTVAPEKPLSKKEKIRLGLIAAAIIIVFVAISSFFIDYKKMFGGVKDRMAILKIEDIELVTTPYDDYVKVELVKLDKKIIEPGKGGVYAKITRGEKWDAVASDEIKVSENGTLSWNEILVMSNLKRGYIPCRITGASIDFEGRLPIDALHKKEEAKVFLNLPSRGLVKKIVLSR